MDCPKCSNKLEYIAGITNMHLTGDDKDISIKHCNKCNKDYFFVSMEAWLSYGINSFDFCIPITKDESENLIDVVKSCPNSGDTSCNCPAHKTLDAFDYDNQDRRIVIKDEIEKYRDP